MKEQLPQILRFSSSVSACDISHCSYQIIALTFGISQLHAITYVINDFVLRNLSKK